jgi:hypothetical protein
MPREQIRQVAPPAASTTTWAWPGDSDCGLWAWAMDWWIDPQLSLSRELELETARRAIPRLHRHELEARLDSALVHAITFDHLLRQALARVMELEAKEALAAPPLERHQEWARDLLAELRPGS